MRYLEIRITASPDKLEDIYTKLSEIDVYDYAVEDPRDIDEILEKPLGYEWDYIDDSVLKIKEQNAKLTVYLEMAEEGDPNYAETVKKNDEILDNIKKSMDGIAISVDYVFNDDRDWKDEWKKYFKPTKISNSIVVKPTWEEYEKKPGEKVLEIDPGMAFGTGTHETTSLCVKLMEKYLTPGGTVLDVGTGSGILCIAGALLGASDLLGIEIDPLAVDIANENLRLNKVDGVAKAVYGDLTKGVTYRADIVVANLMADLVMLLSKDVKKHLKDGGIYISSGILIEKEELVKNKIIESGFEIVEIMEDGMWCAIAAK